MWLLPGLADAATRLEFVATADLCTRRTDARLQLGLRRRFASRGISLVHALPLDGACGRLRLDAGATLSVPAELELSASELCANSAKNSAQSRKGGAKAVAEPAPVLFALDLDRLDLRLEL